MRDFASFLDEVLEHTAPAGAGGEPLHAAASTPSMPFSFVAGEAAESAADGTPERVATYLGLGAEWMTGEMLPDTSPEAIARELALHSVSDLKSLARLRREFAFRNHPDRVNPAWRDLAMVRMQTANRLIDEARQRFTGRRS